LPIRHDAKAAITMKIATMASPSASGVNQFHMSGSPEELRN